MIKELWINLPVKNVAKSKDFFTALGFTVNPNFPGGSNAASLFIGQKNIVLMLFDEATFKGFTGMEINAPQTSEVLLSFDAESKEEVDELVKKVIAAGGTSNHLPSEMQSWMYGCVFSDLDGHRWNILYMDMSKMPK